MLVCHSVAFALCSLWGEALDHLIRHMRSPDIVLALSSVSATLALLSVFIEQQQVSPATCLISVS